MEEPESPYVTNETIGNLLQAEPVEYRFEDLKKYRLEFMSYLRPILQEEEEDSDGWNFLATHVRENNAMFHKILEERNRQEAIVNEVS